MKRVLKKIMLILVVFALCNLFNSTYSSAKDVEKQIEKLNEEIKRAQSLGDEKALNEALEKYEQVLNENPELKDGLANYKQTGIQIIEHKNKAEKYFSQDSFNKALKEYQEILTLTAEGDNRHNFASQRVLAFIEIGKIHLQMANRAFENVLGEKMSSAYKKHMEDKIRSLKIQSLKLSVDEQVEYKKE